MSKGPVVTKVLISADLLDYRQAMKDGLCQVIRYNYVEGVRRPERVEGMEAPRFLEDLLPPPCIALLFLDEYDGQDPEQDYIAAEVYSDFGLVSMEITIRDEHGNLIERGGMYPFPGNSDLWDYPPKSRVPLGTTVIIQVTALDCLGGLATRWMRKTMGEE
jgi:hypothetical protein